MSTMDGDRLSCPVPISVDKWGNSILEWLGVATGVAGHPWLTIGWSIRYGHCIY